MRVLIILALYICFVTRNKTAAICAESRRNSCDESYMDVLGNLVHSSGKSPKELKKEFCWVLATTVKCYKYVGCYNAGQEKQMYESLARAGVLCGGCMPTYNYVLMSLSAVLIMVNNKF